MDMAVASQVRSPHRSSGGIHRFQRPACHPKYAGKPTLGTPNGNCGRSVLPSLSPVVEILVRRLQESIPGQRGIRRITRSYNWYGPYPPRDTKAPTGPAHGLERVICGGSWNDFGNNCRSVHAAGARPQRRTTTSVSGWQSCGRVESRGSPSSVPSNNTT